jgi:hypothetical protein
MFSPQDKLRLKQLRDDGYLKRDNPLTHEILTTLHAHSVERPAWYEAFFTLAVDGSEEVETPALAEAWKVEQATAEEHDVFALFGRSEKPRALRATTVIRQWLKQGLNASPSSVAKAADVSQPRASQVREEWGDEIRALLQEAKCLGLSGEDLYNACNPALPVPTRLIERLRELRDARGSKGGMLRQEFDRWLKAQWDEYKQRNQSKWDTDHPPQWFIRQLSEA